MSEQGFREQVLPNAPCAGTVEVPTKREQQALNELRSIKARVRDLKLARGKNGEISADRSRAIDGELNHLKQEWNRWEQERKEAARERMILLGHEEA